MEKEFVPYTLALELKELGFDEKCYGYFTRDEEFFYFDVDDLSSAYTKNMDNLVVNSVNGLECTAPLKQQAFRWFREKYNLFGKVYIVNFGADEYSFDVYDLYEEKYKYENFIGASASYTGTFETYEEAELACLKKLIQIVKK